jgi:hypothetical protein
MIRHAVTGLYSTGSLCPQWVKQNYGKIWRKFEHAKLAINYYRRSWKDFTLLADDTLNWHIITFVVREENAVTTKRH